jgi:hypothetical protein
MPQGVLGFQYEEEKRASDLTGLAGLPLYFDLIHASGMAKSICQRVNIRAKGQGWSDTGQIVSLMALNLAGGDCVGDLDVLEADEGLSRMLQRFQFQGMTRKERRQEQRRWRKEKKRGVASPSAAFRYLNAFHDEEQEKKRRPQEAFIPEESAGLRGLWQVQKDFIGFVQRRRTESGATLDMDATLVETSKEEALWSYKGYKAYQPLNVYWHEQDLVISSQFRDGNVPCGHRQTEVFERALEQLPEGVTKVYARTDTQGYEREFLQYLAEGKSERFGVIEFAVGADAGLSGRGSRSPRGGVEAARRARSAVGRSMFRPGVGRLQKASSRRADVPLPGDPRGLGPARVAGTGEEAGRASFSRHGGGRQGAPQALRHRHEPGLAGR